MTRRAPILLAVALAALLSACAIAPAPNDAGRFLADEAFRPPSQPIDASRVFAVSEPMRRYLAAALGDGPGTGKQKALLAALRSQGQLKLEYDAAFTRNAAEAFEARTGNCLSLVIMTAAFAREMGIEVRFQDVNVEETWTRSGDLYFAVGHVNVTLGAPGPGIRSRIGNGEQITVDFLPPPDLRNLRWRVIEERTILAMYMNNRAAESLAAGQDDDAYWFAREALRQDPAFAAAYNTLGVIYQRRARLEDAVRVFQHAAEREPRNTRVLSNLAGTLDALGRTAEARALEKRLADLEPDPPFAFFHRGVEAMRAGDYRRARDLFAREVDRSPHYHEFHFWLALALAKLGEEDVARQHLALAMENSTTRREHDLYAAKLARLRAATAH